MKVEYTVTLSDVVWTPQAAEDCVRFKRPSSLIFRHTCEGNLGPGGGVPMDGPFHGLSAIQSTSFRIVFQVENGQVRVAWVRDGARYNWGRVTNTAERA